MRELLHLGWQRQLDHLTVLVEAAIECGRLRLTTPPRLVAQLLMDTASGALLRAAVAPDPAEADPCTAVHDLPRQIRLVHLGTATSETGMTSSRYAVVRAAAS